MAKAEFESEGQNLNEDNGNETDGRVPKGNPTSEPDLADTCESAVSEYGSWGNEASASLALREESGKGRPLDLEQRTARFGEAIVIFCKRIPEGPVNNRLISQLVGAGTSIGANYCEANDAVSRKEFKLKIGTCRKESRETLFFLRMMATAEPGLTAEARALWREAKELNLIFGAIWRK